MLALILSLALGLPQQAAAAPDRWLAPGGDPAGSARSYARPLREEPELAWTWNSGGQIEGEVSTWDGRVLLGVRESSGRRALVLLDLESGKLLFRQTLRATLPLGQVMDGDAICVRPSPERVDIYRWRDGRIGRPRTIRAKESISAPLLVQGELYLRLDDALLRYDLNRSEATWRAQLPGLVRGRPALLGQRIFTLFYGQDRQVRVAILDRQTGSLLASAPMGSHGGVIPARDAVASLHPTKDRLFVRYPLPVKLQDGSSHSYGSRGIAGAEFSSEATSVHNYNSAPIIYKSGWIAAETAETPSWLQVQREGERWSALSLASAEHHPELASSTVPAALAGNVIYFGGLAADLSTRRILWKRRPSLLRPTPFEQGLLVVEEPGSLSALRAPRSNPGAAASGAAQTITRLESERAKQMAELAKSSIRIDDAALTRRLIDSAQQLGASSSDLAPAFRALDRISDNSKRANPLGKSLRALLAQEAALLAQPGLELGRLAAMATGEEQRALLRGALERDAQQAAALALVRGLLPADATVAEPFDALGWLNFLDVSARLPVGFIGTKSSDEERLALAKERDAWRPDLTGYRSGRLFIIAPSNDPGAVARCLESGELLCDLLEQVFGDITSGATSEPMLLLLYSSREAYITQSNRAGSGPEQALGWTAGHYSAQENRSRLFVPTLTGSNDSLLEVYAHELTHHWLATRSPFASRAGSTQAPFWIVEGFASLISEFSLSPGNGSWQARNPRAGSLDTLSSLSASQLLPWDQVLSMGHAEFTRLSKEAHLAAPLNWTLGLSTPLSATQLFYKQSSALCQMLYNGSPQSRQQLLAYVQAWYSQDNGNLDAAQSFGASPETLGKRSMEYAQRSQR